MSDMNYSYTDSSDPDVLKFDNQWDAHYSTGLLHDKRQEGEMFMVLRVGSDDTETYWVIWCTVPGVEGNHAVKDIFYEKLNMVPPEEREISPGWLAFDEAVRQVGIEHGFEKPYPVEIN